MKRKFSVIFSLLLTGLCCCAVTAQETAELPVRKILPQNLLEVPWLSTYYIQPQVKTSEPVKIGFYVTDWFQSEYRLGNDSFRFNAELRISRKDGTGEAKVFSMNNLKAGNHVFDAGNFPEGEYLLALSASDMFGRKSPVLFHEFMVKKDFAVPESETYRMTPADLEKYNISNRGDLGIFHFIDAAGLKKAETAALVAEAAKKIKVPAGKYVVVAGAEKFNPAEFSNHRGAKNTAVPEWLPNSWSWESCQVIYAPDYNKEKVEQDAVATGSGLNRFLEDAAKNGCRKVVLLPGTYRISNTTTIDIPSGLTLDLNGAVIKMNQFAGSGGVQIRIRNCVDSHVVNGIVEGDYFEHDYANSPNHSEWVMGLNMDGESKYSSFERILVRYITGYGTGNGFHGHRLYQSFRKFQSGTIDEKTGNELPDVKGLVVSTPEKIADAVKDYGYLAVSRYLGYQGRIGDDWTLRFHFYDKDGKYLETVHGRQYRRVRIPEKAASLRVTAYASDAEKVKGLTINSFCTPWNSWFQDIFILSARCVGMAPSAMYNFRFENCSFVRSGENLAKCAFDSEDGWDMMQDVWIVRNQFFKNPVNELLTCAGHNFIIEDNECSIYLWSRTNGYVIRNNAFRNASYGVAASRARTGLVRISGNTYTGRVSMGDDGDTVDPALTAVNPDQWEAKEGKPQVQTPWFATMKDFENAKKLSLRANAMLSGATLKDKKLGTVALAYSTVENCDFSNEICGSGFFKSVIKNIKGNITWGKTLSVTESKLEDSTIFIMNGDTEKGAVVIRNADLKNVSFHISYWILPQKVIFENCTITNENMPLLRIPVYAIGDFQFVNCRIDTGSAPAVEVYDMRRNGNGKGAECEKQPGKITFRNCTVTNQKNCVIDPNSRGEKTTQKKIILTDKDSTYTGSLVSWMPEFWQMDSAQKKD